MSSSFITEMPGFIFRRNILLIANVLVSEAEFNRKCSLMSGKECRHCMNMSFVYMYDFFGGKKMDI
jgi:hypothetical protein